MKDVTEARRPSNDVGNRVAGPRRDTRPGLSDAGIQPSRRQAAVWALGLSSLTIAGLGALTLFLVLSHAMAYGVGAVVAPEVVPPLDGDHYGLAFAVGVVTDLATATSLAWVAAGRFARSWPPAALGLTAAIAGAAAGASALLMTLGMNPVAFVLAL